MRLPLYTQLPTASWKARPPAIVNGTGGRRKLDKQSQPGKHVCIFEIERTCSTTNLLRSIDSGSSTIEGRAKQTYQRHCDLDQIEIPATGRDSV